MNGLPKMKSMFAIKKVKSKVGLTAAESEAVLYKLSAFIVPRNYVLCIKPNLTSSTFEGCVAVKLQVSSIPVIHFASYW